MSILYPNKLFCPPIASHPANPEQTGPVIREETGQNFLRLLLFKQLTFSAKAVEFALKLT
jgi:hypothetical protein